MDFFKKGLNSIKDKVSQADLEKKLVEATPNETGFSNISLLNEISSRTDDSEQCKIIVKYCMKLLTLKPKFWKKILRALQLIEHVVKTGSQNFVEQIKDERDKIRDLHNFTYEDNDKDRGEQSKPLFIIIKIYSKRKIKIYF